MLILKSLAAGEMHGLAIPRRVKQITDAIFVVKRGSLFLAVHRMEEEGWTSSFWGDSENNRPREIIGLAQGWNRAMGRISLAIAQAVESS